MLGDTNIGPAVHRTVLHRGRKFDFESLRVTAPDGTSTTRECVRHPGAVVILPVLLRGDGPELVLIRNWRASLETWIWELPAGTLEKGEDPRVCAERELREETGYGAATFHSLTRFHTSPGLSDEIMYAFVATGLLPGPQALEEDEQVTVHVKTLRATLELIESGSMTDSKSILTILLAMRAGQL